jgi:hypothetical protein
MSALAVMPSGAQRLVASTAKRTFAVLDCPYRRAPNGGPVVLLSPLLGANPRKSDPDFAVRVPVRLGGVEDHSGGAGLGQTPGEAVGDVVLGGVMDVDHRGGDVGVAHVGLDVRERELLYGQGAEGVARRGSAKRIA